MARDTKTRRRARGEEGKSEEREKKKRRAKKERETEKELMLLITLQDLHHLLYCVRSTIAKQRHLQEKKKQTSEASSFGPALGPGQDDVDGHGHDGNDVACVGTL